MMRAIVDLSSLKSPRSVSSLTSKEIVGRMRQTVWLRRKAGGERSGSETMDEWNSNLFTLYDCCSKILRAVGEIINRSFRINVGRLNILRDSQWMTESLKYTLHTQCSNWLGVPGGWTPTSVSHPTQLVSKIDPWGVRFYTSVQR